MARKILLLQTAFPGDIVLTTPLIRNLKRLFPGSRLTVITTPQGRELLQEMKEIDTLISYDKRGNEKGLVNFLRLARRLKRERFDLCLSPHLSLRTSLLLYLTGAHQRIGYSNASGAFLYTTTVPREMSRHEVERILSLLTPLGVDEGTLDRFPQLEISEDSAGRVERRLMEAGVSREDRIVGIAPGSVWGTKRWIAEGYGALLDRLVEDHGVRVMLIGAPAERESGERIKAVARHGAIDMIGKTPLSDLAALISRCTLLIGNDSAPGHVAAAVGVPVVTIFGPTSPAFGYPPYGRNVQIVEKEIPCRPCHHHGPMECPERHFRCMREISVEDVMAAVKKTGVSS